MTLVKRELDMSYHVDHFGLLLHPMGWTVQKPDQERMHDYATNNMLSNSVPSKQDLLFKLFCSAL